MCFMDKYLKTIIIHFLYCCISPFVTKLNTTVFTQIYVQCTSTNCLCASESTFKIFIMTMSKRKRNTW